MRIAKGEYICFVDDDDFILEIPGKSFDEYISYLFQNNIFIVSGDTKRFPFSEKYDDSINESKSIQKFNTTIHRNYFCSLLKKHNLITKNEYPKYFTKEIIKIHNLISTSGIIINKNILNYVKEFMPISYGEDWHYWQQILNFSDCLFDSNYIIGYQTDNVKQHEGKSLNPFQIYILETLKWDNFPPHTKKIKPNIIFLNIIKIFSFYNIISK